MSYFEDLARNPAFRQMILDGSSASAAAAALRLPQSEAVIRRAAALVRATGDVATRPATIPTGTTIEDALTHGERHVKSISPRIKTLEALIAECEIDAMKWHCYDVTVKKWDMGAKSKDGEHIIVQEMFGITAKFKPLVEAVNMAAIHDTLVASMTKHAPPYRLPRRAAPAPDRVMMEFSPFDLHLGKLAWHAETESDSYDTGIAEAILSAVADHAIEQARLFRPECILFPVGNDFFHTDSSANQTTSGTQMDADSRHARMFTHGCDLLVSVIDKLRLVAPVEVLTVPGNHDRDSVFKLGTVLHAWYRNDAEVTINNAPTRRKYKHYGCTLLGFTHGDSEKHIDLPLILAQERPQEWAASQFREFHLGHFHKRKETRHTAGDTFGGVVVRVLPSLSATDAWHYAQGYVKSIREAHSHFYSYDNGPIGTVISNINNAALAATIGG